MLCEVGEEEKRDIQAGNGGAGVESQKNARFIKRPKSTRRCFSPPSSFCLKRRKRRKGGNESFARKKTRRERKRGGWERYLTRKSSKVGESVVLYHWKVVTAWRIRFKREEKSEMISYVKSAGIRLHGCEIIVERSG